MPEEGVLQMRRATPGILLLHFLMADCDAPANLSSFVQVSSDGTRFEADGAPFYFAGANCYYLMTRAADENLRHEVIEVLDEVKAAGMTVIRTWAFCDGSEWNALQPAPGEWDERVFAALDWVLAQAGARGLRAVLALTNYWEAYGGIKQYVRWSCERRGVEVTDRAEDFYEDPYCQDVFRTFVATLLARVNTLTGVAYRDDPTILGWELCNEPRCEGDFSGSILQDWVECSAEFLKSLDPHHLLTIGMEGFLGSSTPDLLADNPFNTLKLGCDFLRHHAAPHIDFATAHLWPDTWLPAGAGKEAALRFARRWVNVHADVCTDALGKPLVLAEFGTKAAGRPAFYEKVYDTVLHHMAAGHAVAGTCFWMLAAASYPDYDGFTVYLSERDGGPGGARQCAAPTVAGATAGPGAGQSCSARDGGGVALKDPAEASEGVCFAAGELGEQRLSAGQPGSSQDAGREAARTGEGAGSQGLGTEVGGGGADAAGAAAAGRLVKRASSGGKYTAASSMFAGEADAGRGGDAETARLIRRHAAQLRELNKRGHAEAEAAGRECSLM